MSQSKTEVIRARVTEDEAAKLDALTQRLGAPNASETLRLLLAAASVESEFSESNKEYTVLLEEPLVRVDFARLTMGDFFRILDDGGYAYTMMRKCIVEDVEQIPFMYVPVIAEAFVKEYTQMMKNTTDTYTLQKLFTNGLKDDNAPQ